MKDHYHRKKLQLALQAVGNDTRSRMDDLDHNWVTRESQTLVVAQCPVRSEHTGQPVFVCVEDVANVRGMRE